MADELILATITGEYFQPVRLHYRVSDHAGLLRAFKKLRCVEQDPPRKRWVWLYDREAKKLPFQRSFAQIPKNLHPIVIGSFFPRGKEHLVLDLRSCERAVLAIPFFDKHVPRDVAQVTEADIVNKLFSGRDNMQLTPDSLFDHQPSTSNDPEAVMRKIKDQVAHVQDLQERLRIVMEGVQAQAKRPLPEIERLYVHYYEEGILSFATTLKMRQIVARQHWLGHADYSLFDAISSVEKSM